MPPDPSPPPSDSPPTSLSARRLPLPHPLPSPVAAVLADAASLSIALLLADSSALLFPSLPPSKPPLSIPPPLSAAAFAHAAPSPAASPSTLFFAASPADSSGALLLRAFSVSSSPAAAACLPLTFKRRRAAALALDSVPFGDGVRLAGATNVLALHSLALAEIWLLGIRVITGGAELQKCAVIKLETVSPVYSMAFALGSLLLAENGGVRAFPLNVIMKGKRRSEGVLEAKAEGKVPELSKEMPQKKNGVINGVVLPKEIAGRQDDSGTSSKSAPCKLTTIQIKQNSGDYSSYFFALRCVEEQDAALEAARVISVHPFSKGKVLAIDSAGALHVLSVPTMPMKGGTTNQNSCMTFSALHPVFEMKVQKLAVFPSSQTNSHVFWISDCGHSVHIMPAVEADPSVNDNGDIDNKPANIELSVSEAIFMSEKVKDIIPLSKNEVLILGQENIFIYGFT